MLLRFADFRDENYNRYQRNVKLLHLLKEKLICLTLTEKKHTISRQNWTRPCWRALACTFTDSAETFFFLIRAAFSKFLSKFGLPRFRKWNSKQKNYKNDRWGVEKSIDALFFHGSRAIWQELLTNHGNWKISPGLTTNLGTVNTYSYLFGTLWQHTRLVWSHHGYLQTMARPNSPDMPPKRTKKVRLGIIIIQQIVTMPIYGKGALDICHPYMADILRYT